MSLRTRVFLCLFAASVTLQAQDDFKQRNFSSSGGHLSQDGAHKLFSVFGQPIARSVADRSETQTGFLQVVDVIIEDDSAPIIDYTGGSQKISKQNPPTIMATISDNVFVASAKIHYRQITSDSWNVAAMVKGQNDSFSKTVEGSWFDAIGMEYWLEAADATPNVTRNPATGSYYAYTASTTEVIPNTVFGFGTEVNNYKIISFPYHAPNKSVTSLFNELGPYSDTEWRMSTYNTSTKEFREYPSFTQLERGVGYWFLAKTPVDISVEQVESLPGNRNALHRMTLQPGWNLIGNPYPVSIQWSNVLTINNDDPRLGDLVLFDNGFGPGITLAPYSGGYVFLEDGGNLEILIPFSGQTMEGGRLENDDFSSDISSNSWLVDLVVEQNGLFNSLGGFGMHEEASMEKDRYDNLNPPRFLDLPEIGFPHPSHSLGEFSRDIIPTQEEATWSFTVDGSLNDAISLQWENDFGSNSFDLFMLDEKNLQVTDLREVNEYRFNLQPNHSFRIFYGENSREKVLPQEVSISSAYPNPVSLGSSVRFRLALPDSDSNYEVRVELFTGQGRKVSSYSKSLKQGVQELSVSTENGSGVSGLYFYKVFVRSGIDSRSFTGKVHMR